MFLNLGRLVKEAQEAGEIRQDLDGADIAHTIITSIRGIVYEWCLQDSGFDLEAAAVPLASVLTDGLLPR